MAAQKNDILVNESHVKTESYVENAVREALAAYSEKNPLSAKAHQAATAHMPGGNTRTTLYNHPFPLSMKSASGKTLTSLDGHEYVDFLGDYSAGLFGHSNPDIARAIHTATEHGWNLGGENVYEKKLAEAVTQRFAAGGVELVRFTNSGTEANTLAIGTALHFTGRKKVLVFGNSYHGATFFFTMDYCRWLHNGCKGPAPPPHACNLPHDFVTAPFNNVVETKSVIDSLPKDSLAAVLVEVVQGSSGCRPALPEFLTYLRSTATQLGALLIVDEVMTSRLGPSGALALSGNKADLLCMGKWIGGGMNFGAFGGRRDVMGIYDPRNGASTLYHPGTFNNNIFTMCAGVTGLQIYNAVKVHEFNALGDKLKTGLTDILTETGLYPMHLAEHLKDIREIDSFDHPTRLYTGDDSLVSLPKVLITGRGTMLNLRFLGADATSWHVLYYQHMLSRGFYIAGRGYTPMSIEVTNDDVEAFLQAAREFLKAHAAELLK